LEWQTSSPPTIDNFSAAVSVTEKAYAYENIQESPVA
jgi:hypothetical protein